MPNQDKHLEITPISEWLDDYEVVTMPSGKRVGLRQVDVLSILTEDGEIPNLLLPIIYGHTNGLAKDASGNVVADVDDIRRTNELIRRVANACFVNPVIVDDMDAVRRGEGIHFDMLSSVDKYSLITYGMGGKAAVEATGNFLKKQIADLVALQSGDDIPSESKPDSEHS